MRGRTTLWGLGWWLLACLTVWAQGSTTLSLSPLPETKVSNEDLMVSVSLSGPLVEAMPLSQARLFLNDKEVTLQCFCTDRLLSYRPYSPPNPGRWEARLEFPNGVVRRWSFQVVAPSLITSVEHSGEESLGEYEELTVTMRAEPGHQGSFRLGRSPTEHPLQETEPGLYIGTYTVMPGDFFLGEPVLVRLQKGNRVEELEAEKPVNLFGHLFRVVIQSPKSGSQTPKNFDIKGRTRPGCKVTFVPDLSFNRNSRAPNTQGSGTDGSFETWADEEGYFTVNYGVPMTLPNLSVVMSVFATTPKGERSVPVILRYHF